MDIREFQTKSKRTCPTLDSLNINLAHMVLGINSEIVELEDAISVRDYVNVGEEVADLLWYVGNYCTFKGLAIPHPLENIEVRGAKIMIADLYYSTSELQDMVKKFLAYGKKINSSLEILYLQDIVDLACSFVKKYNLDLEVILQNNVDKLLVRFPTGFSTEKAINRDLGSERKELEKA